jgi:hypothetical protein
VSNVPWVSYSMNFCPLSKINDGQNDIMYVDASEGSRVSLGQLLIDGDDGNYFDSEGEMRPSLALNYVKCD